MSLTRINREERIALTPFSARHHMAQILDALVEVVDESVGELQMIECVDCEGYLREIDRLESRLAAALDALRSIADKPCHGQTTRKGIAVRCDEWMESRSTYCGSCEARRALAGGGR